MKPPGYTPASGRALLSPVPFHQPTAREAGETLGNRLIGDGWEVGDGDDGAYRASDSGGRESLVELATRQRTEEAARVLAGALKGAGFPALARLVVTESVADGPASVTLLPMRPDEARTLAALIEKAGRQ